MIEAMKEALEAFEHIKGMRWSIVTTATCKRNIANLRQAIDQAKLVRQDEREACIEIVTKNASLETAWKCEEEIRARGNT
jgi:hypothetical protein